MSRTGHGLVLLYRRVITWLFGYDYFISYCHGDADHYVHSLQKRLSHKRLGFVDSSPEGLYVGCRLSHRVTKALRRSKVLIVVYTDSVRQRRWTRLESRYFKTVRPARPFLPISAAANTETLQGQLATLYDSDRAELAEILRVWLDGDAANVPTSTDIDPLWAVEVEVDDLHHAEPSERVIYKIEDAFKWMSVPQKGFCAVVTLLLFSALAIGLSWVQFSNNRANQILADLSRRMGKENIEERGTEGAKFYLSADIRSADLADSARLHGGDMKDEFAEVTTALRRYDFYRRWGGALFHYQGVHLAYRSVSDAVAKPTKPFPATLVEVRLSGQHLSDGWLDSLQNCHGCHLLSLRFEDIASEPKLIDVLNTLCVEDLRVSRCRGVDVDTFNNLSDEACLALKAVALSELDAFVVQSDADEQAFAQFLQRCRHLESLRMLEMPRCRFSEITAQAISEHPSLSNCDSDRDIQPRMLSEEFLVAWDKRWNGRRRISAGIQDIEQADIQELEQVE